MQYRIVGPHSVTHYLCKLGKATECAHQKWEPSNTYFACLKDWLLGPNEIWYQCFSKCSPGIHGGSLRLFKDLMRWTVFIIRNYWPFSLSFFRICMVEFPLVCSMICDIAADWIWRTTYTLSQTIERFTKVENSTFTDLFFF